MRLMQVKWGVLPVVAATLVACGGGGAESPDQVASTSLSGVVAKGPVKGAKVTIFAADGKTVLARDILTGEGGKYTASFPSDSKGPFLIESDLTGAEITDEVTGKTYTGKSGEKLRAVVADASSAVNLTPFSDMAADLALEAAGGGPLTTGAAEAANKKIRQILNNTDFLTASPTAGDLLVALKAVQTLVNKNEGGLAAVLKQLRDASAEGVVSRNLVADLQAACETCGAAFNPEVAELPVAQVSAIDVVKALFKDLRDTLLAYSNDGGTGDLDTAGVKITDALAEVVRPVDAEQLKVLAVFSDAEEMYREFKAGESTRTVWRSSDTAYGQVAGSTMTGPAVVARYGCELARATLTDVPGGYKDVSSDYTIAGLTKDNVNVMACYGIGTQGRLFPGDGKGAGFYQAVLFIPTGESSFKYVHQLRTGGFTGAGTTSRVVGRAVYGDLSVNRDASGSLTGFAIAGKLVPGLVGSTSESYALLDRVDANLDFTSAKGASTANASVSGSLVLMKKDGSEASRVDITTGNFAFKTDVPTSYHDVISVGDGTCPDGYAPAFGTASPYLWCDGMVSTTTSVLSSMTLDVSVSAPGVKFQGIATAGSPSFDKSGSVYYPTVTSLQGKLYEADGTGYRVLLDGLAKVELQGFSSFDASLGQASPLKASFDGQVLLKSRPAMGFTFAGARDSSDNRSGTGSFYWNGKSLSFEGKADKSLVVRNDDGVTFTIPHNGSKSYQPIFKGTEQVGRINLDLQRVEYADGSYEQY